MKNFLFSSVQNLLSVLLLTHRNEGAFEDLVSPTHCGWKAQGGDTYWREGDSPPRLVLRRSGLSPPITLVGHKWDVRHSVSVFWMCSLFIARESSVCTIKRVR